MNDIEVLEDYINRYDIQDLDNEGIEFKNALENLLKENKDLQKSVDQIYDDYQDIGKMYFNLTEKIESKIEELEHKGENYIFNEKDNAVRLGKIQVLEELLKGE